MSALCPRPGRRAAAWRRHDGARAGQGQDRHGRCWTYVRDDRPFGGRAPPAALFYYSRDRSGEHPRQHLAAWTGILQADAYGGYGKLYADGRSPGPSSKRRAGPCPAQVLRAGRYRGQCPTQGPAPSICGRLTDCPGSGPADRRPVRHRAPPQRAVGRSTARRAPATQRPSWPRCKHG